MAKSSYIIHFAHGSNVPEERTSTRIRAFLEKTEPLLEDEGRPYDLGRALIEDLARCCDAEEHVQWEPEECAQVLRFLHWIKPIDGQCFCNDTSRIDATCGFHAVLEFMEEQMLQIAATTT